MRFPGFNRAPRVREEHRLDDSVNAGDVWTDPYAWFTDCPATVPMPGFYALEPDGKAVKRPLVRLQIVELADGFLVEVSGHDDPPQRAQGGGPVESKREVQLDSHVIGEGDSGGGIIT